MAAEKGSAEACYHLGDLYLEQGNHRSAFQSYMRGATFEHPESLQVVTDLYMDGKIILKNFPLTVQHYQMVVDKNNDVSSHILNKIYETPEIIEWVFKQTDKNDHVGLLCMKELGDMYLEDKILKKNVERAIFWYQKLSSLYFLSFSCFWKKF